MAGDNWMVRWILVNAMMASYCVSDTDSHASCTQTTDNANSMNNVQAFDQPAEYGQAVKSPLLKESRPDHKTRRIRQVAIVGSPCQENIDCQTTDGGAYCGTTKRCDCLSTYVNINGYCWAKRNPGNSCQYTEQCTAVSPNTFCDTDGLCKCTNNLPAYTTVDGDGPFCLRPGECPTNAANSKLRDYETGVDVKCGGAMDLECMAKDRQTSPQIMYNCVCNKSDLIPDKPCALDELAFCCPSRASACIQGRDEGTTLPGGGGAQQRWWYNTITRTCEQFWYRGNGGNGNNFETKAYCETYCKTICPRGVPETMTAGCASRGNTCVNRNYKCRVEGKITLGGYCCPTDEFLCDNRGGIPITQPDTFAGMPDVGDKSYNVKPVNRWYYHTVDRRCTMFLYQGFGGTFNNFQTEEECLRFCLSSACASGGEPLRDNSGLVINCGVGTAGAGSCPAKYECTASGFCCPSVDFICSFPQAVGGCGNFIDRWWFNPKTRTCEKFAYSGCQGNANNFGSFSECMKRCTASAAKPICPRGDAAKDTGGREYVVCSGVGPIIQQCPVNYYCHYDGIRYGCCPTRSKTCSVDRPDPGTPCITPVTRWYYNADTKQCDIFTYNGCDGNSNNFPTKIDCQDYCGVGGCPEGGEPFRELVTGAYRACGTGNMECPSGYRCCMVTLAVSRRSSYCCPKREFVCASAKDAGHRCGTSTLTRYHFNIISRTCESFVYNGCSGNRNNFASVDECTVYCSSAGCPAGEVALQHSTNGKVTPCDSASSNGCPKNYKCFFSTTMQQGVCCGSNAPAGACPSGLIAYMDSFTSSPLQCQPNVAGSCPNGIFCQYSYSLQNSFCCGPLVAPCPLGGDPYIDTDSKPRQCTPGLIDACPSEYTCQAISVDIGGMKSTMGYCCGQPKLCGGVGFVPYLANNKPVPCQVNPMPSPCPAPSTCRLNVNTQLAYCCIPSRIGADVCATGKEPYLVKGLPALCSQSSTNMACPAGYTCDPHMNSSNFYCCRMANAPVAISTIAGCPSPSVPLRPIRPCSPGVARSCPTGYFCNWDQSSSRFICCGKPGAVVSQSAGYCPSTSQVYTNPSTGRPQACVLGSMITGCPNGYGCHYSVLHGNYYCCTRKAASRPDDGCPNGTAFFYPGTRAPVVCSRTNGCPRGYSCQKSTTSTGHQCCSVIPKRGKVFPS